MENTLNRRKRVLLMGINFSPELTGIGKYSGEMIDWLSKNNYDCTVVSSFPYYPNWEVQKPHKARFYKKEIANDGHLTLYRCPLYVPKKPTGAKRILHDASFFITAFFMVFCLLFKKGNDYIFCIAPPFHLGFLGVFYKFFKGGKLVCHIQDLQIEAARDLQIIKSNTAFKVLFGLESFILKRADYISSISSGMIEKIARKVNTEVIYFPNWVDTESFFPISKTAELKKRWGFKSSDKIVLYSGSIGEKQGLETLIPIAKDLGQQESIKLVICGDGPYKQDLIRLSDQEGLTNMLFLPLQPMQDFNAFLNITDIHLVLQKKSACDLVMPSKLTTIWSAGGLALITAERNSSLRNLVLEHDMAVVIDCEDQEALKSAILSCCQDNNKAKRINARHYAKSFLSKDSILQKMVATLERTAFPLENVPTAVPRSSIDRQAVAATG